MVVINDFSTFDDSKGGAYLRRGPFPGLGDTDRNRIRIATSCKSISLRSRYAEFAVPGTICNIFTILWTRTYNIRPSNGKEG